MRLFAIAYISAGYFLASEKMGYCSVSIKISIEDGVKNGAEKLLEKGETKES